MRQGSGSATRLSGQRTGSDREGVVRRESRRLSFRKVRVEQALELLEAVLVAGQLRVGLAQRRRGRAHDLRPGVVELEPKPVQEEDGASVGGGVGVAAEGMVDEVLPR